MEVNWGNVESYSEVQSVNGLTGKVQLNIPTKTSDLVNDSGFVSNSNFATKAELKEVEKKIPNVSNFATISDVNNSVSEVEKKIPSVANLATKEELTAVEQKIPIVSGFATKQELNTVKSSIPDTTGLATKEELSNVAADIPETYLKVANLGDGSLTIINNKGESVIFTPTTTGGGAVDSVNGQTGTVVIDIPTKVSELKNDSGYLTSHQDISNLATKAELQTVENKIPDVSNFTTTSYVDTAITNKGYQTQTQVQALINDAISNIKNANEVSY